MRPVPHARRVLVVLACSLVLPAAASAKDVRVASPDGHLVAIVATDGGGPVLSAQLDGKPLLAPERLGVRLQGADLRSGLRLTSVKRTRMDEPVHTLTGPRQTRTLRGGEAVLTFAGARTLRLRVRVAPDGIAYRYELPGAATKLLGEAGGFAPIGIERQWTAAHTPNGEAQWTSHPAGAEQLPTALMRLGTHDRYILVTEAGVDGRNAAARLVRDGALIRFGLARQGGSSVMGPVESGAPLPVDTGRDWHSPWRLAIAGRLSQVAVSTLVADLAAPPTGDFSWVRPGTAAWSWWSEHDSPSSLARQLQYVDFAAQHGWRYVTVDSGWEDLGDAGLQELAAHAKARGVGLIFWFIRFALADPAQRAAALDRLAALGAAGIKVDFFDSETQPTMQLVDDILRDAAKRHLVVDLHGFTVPRGLERTWPNLLSYEGVRGAEYYPLAVQYPGVAAMAAPTPQDEAILPFTRAVAGPEDFTPATFTAPGRLTSDAHELALTLVLPTGLLHPADSIEAYTMRPAATAVLDALPVTWDASRLLAGDPGRTAVIARRHGAQWWVGGVFAGPRRTIAVKLGFLAASRWRAEVTQDAPGPDVATRTQAVTRASILRLPVESNGGFVIRLRR
ncbi:MAG: hypothetical protein JWQ18_2508 [Conexibacter sp.]|nr:hypothetical protein [Conexibacter sp.]